MDNKELAEFLFMFAVIMFLLAINFEITNISKALETQNQTIQTLIEKINK